MHTTNNDIDLELFRVAAEWSRIASNATHAAIEENRRLGIPNAYSINGHIYYELPNGELTLEEPECFKRPGHVASAGDEGSLPPNA
jgi:hypothetical protein